MQQWLNTLLIVDARHSLLTGAEGIDGERAIPAAEGGMPPVAVVYYWPETKNRACPAGGAPLQRLGLNTPYRL